MLGLDLITAISGQHQQLATLGQSGNIIGPTGSYQTIPDMGKFFVCWNDFG